jgi:thioredoxin-related protein
MKKKNSVLTIILLLTFFLSGLTPRRADDPKAKKNAVTWLSFAQGLASSQKEKKMLVVDFYTTWCGWCKVMDKETYGNENVIKFAKEKLVLVKVNAESNDKTRFRDKEYTYRELALAFGVNGYPATAFIDANGEVLTVVSGYIPADKFIPVLEYLADGHHKNMKFEEYLAKRNKPQAEEDKSVQ